MKTIVLIFALLFTFLLRPLAEDFSGIYQKGFHKSEANQSMIVQNISPNLELIDRACCDEEVNSFSICKNDCKFFTSPPHIYFKGHLAHYEIVKANWLLNDLIKTTFRPPIT